jgi:hypothetical protein
VSPRASVRRLASTGHWARQWQATEGRADRRYQLQQVAEHASTISRFNTVPVSTSTLPHKSDQICALVQSHDGCYGRSSTRSIRLLVNERATYRQSLCLRYATEPTNSKVPFARHLPRKVLNTCVFSLVTFTHHLLHVLSRRLHVSVTEDHHQVRYVLLCTRHCASMQIYYIPLITTCYILLKFFFCFAVDKTSQYNCSIIIILF